MFLLRIHGRLSTVLKTSNKVHEAMFFDMSKYVYSESLFNKLYFEIKHKCEKNFFRTKKAVQKMPSFFFRELQLTTVLLLIRESYMSWSTRFVSLKLGAGFSIFDSALFLLNFIFFLTRSMNFLTLKRHNSFQN